MTIEGLGTFELTGPVNECETLLRLLRLKTFSYKPHIMVTHEGYPRYRFYTYDDDDPAYPAPIVMCSDMTLEPGEEKFIVFNQWLSTPEYREKPYTGPKAWLKI